MTIEKAKSKKQKNRRITLQEIKKENPFYIPNVNAFNSLNNIFYVTELSKESLTKVRENLISCEDYHIDIDFPDITGSLKKSKKRKSRTVKVLKNAIRYDLYSNSLISSVASTEGFLESVVKIALLKDPRRLSHSVKKQAKKGKLTEPEIEVKIDDSTIPLRNVLNANSLEDLYQSVIDDKLLQLMYASPNDYFGYLKNALGVELPDEVIKQYIEIKATRDLLTHSQGFVNEVYVQKAGEHARTTNLKQRIPLGNDYFAESIGLMKKLLTITYKEFSKVYLDVTNGKELYPAKTKYS